MKKRFPDFLKRIDHHLLTNYPTVWRTRVHYFLFFGLIGNLLAILFSVLSITVFDSFPDEHSFYAVLSIGLVFCGFLLLFWGFDQHRFPIRIKSFKDALTTVSLYVVCVLMVGSVFLTGSYTATRQIAVKGEIGMALSYENFLHENAVFTRYSNQTVSNALTKEQTVKAREILDFFNVEYKVDIADESPNQIVLNDSYRLRKKVKTYRNAQTFYYNKDHSKEYQYTSIFSVLLIGILLAVLLVPALFIVWSGVGFPMTLLVIGGQFFAGLGIVSLTLLGGSVTALPAWYLVVVGISIACILSVTKPGKISQFFAWGTVPFASVFILILYFINIADSSPISYLPLILFGVLAAVGGVLLLSVMSHLVASKSELPGVG